ncbi:MAG: GAF domain-containing protein [Bacteroides sp.]|nr:GAF domain-containing protein [Bacteroides sp.]
MAEQLTIPAGSKAEKYAFLLPQIRSVVSNETNRIANLANVSAMLREMFGFFWVGFYLVEGDQLVLGPFQGPLACTRIRKGRGVCGTAWEKKELQWVPDVDLFPEHIACSSSSRSEVVVPLIRKDEVWGVLDVDSVQLNYFDETDTYWLAKLCDEILSSL